MIIYHLSLHVIALALSIDVGVKLLKIWQKTGDRLVRLMGAAFIAAGLGIIVDFVLRFVVPLNIFEQIDLPILLFVMLVPTFMAAGVRPRIKESTGAS